MADDNDDDITHGYIYILYAHGASHRFYKYYLNQKLPRSIKKQSIQGTKLIYLQEVVTLCIEF